MLRMLGVGIEALSAAVILLPILFIWKRKLSENMKGYIYYSVFALYLSAVYAVVGLPSINNYAIELTVELMPIIPMVGDFENSVLNVILFIPLGMLLPIFSDKFISMKRVALFGFGTSLTIETLQIFTYRATDVNDVILNTLGATIGYFIVKKLMEKQLIVSQKRNIQDGYMLIGMVFIVMFFIQPFISNLFWSMLSDTI